MSQELVTVTAQQSIQEAARAMLDADTGVLPIVESDNLAGLITDRDIAVRAVAEGRGPDTPVSEVMTGEVLSVYDDQDVEDAALVMSDRQVRRLAVKSRADERLIGMISLADIARSAQSDEAEVALGGISEPGGEHNQSAEG
jgi:CBS domain-containing protein